MFFQFFVHIVDPNDWGSVGRTLYRNTTSSQMLGEAPSRVGAASRAGLMMRIMRLRPGRMRISRMMMMMMRRRTSMSTRMKMRMRMMRVSNDGDDCGDDW